MNQKSIATEINFVMTTPKELIEAVIFFGSKRLNESVGLGELKNGDVFIRISQGDAQLKSDLAEAVGKKAEENILDQRSHADAPTRLDTHHYGLRAA